MGIFKKSEISIILVIIMSLLKIVSKSDAAQNFSL